MKLCTTYAEVVDAMNQLQSDIHAETIGIDFLNVIENFTKTEDYLVDPSDGYLALIMEKYGLDLQNATIASYIKTFLEKESAAA